MRQFDRRERDRECLRIALRLKGNTRVMVRRMALQYTATPAEVVKEIIEAALIEPSTVLMRVAERMTYPEAKK